MDNIPKKIISITGSGYCFVDSRRQTRRFSYYLNKGTVEEKHFSVLLPKYSRREKTTDIIDDSRNFVNGFKVVQTANKEYAYVREEDNTLLPFRYDIATDFNEYGYAMVGKDGKVSWIDKSFKYLNSEYEMLKEDSTEFNGFLSVSNFSKGEHPLSKLCNIGYNNEVRYFTTDGKIKNFSLYDGEIIRDGDSIKKFSCCSTEFNDKGYATANEGDIILLSSGYYLSVKDLIRICEEKGFLDTINNVIERQEQAYVKFLRDVETNTMNLSENISKINKLESEYNILGVESIRDRIISQYGEDVYRRIYQENKNDRTLATLGNNFITSDVIDLELFQSLLSKQGIPSYIDYEQNIFHYNAINHVKKKK